MTDFTKDDIARIERPNGWVDLRGAYLEFGVSVVGLMFSGVSRTALDSQTGKPFRGAAHVPTPAGYRFSAGNLATPSEYRFSVDELADVYGLPIAKKFASAVRAGKIRTAYQRNGGGPLTAIPRDWWQTADPWLRFRHCTINPDPEALYVDAPGDCWIWVNWQDLRASCAALEAWRESLPAFEEMNISPADTWEVKACTFQGLPARVVIREQELHIMCPWLPDMGEGAAASAPNASNDPNVGPIVAPTFANDASPAAPLASTHSGGAGRPSAMHIIEDMMLARFEVGIFCATMGDEAVALLEEFGDNPDYKLLRAPTPQTIRNRLGPRYRRLKDAIPK